MSPQRQYGLAPGDESQKSLNMLSSLSKYKRTQAPVATITCYSTQRNAHSLRQTAHNAKN